MIKYIITFVLGIVSASFISIILTVLRCGIPICKAIIKNVDAPEDEKKASQKLIKKYHLSLFLDSFIVVVLSLIIYFTMNEAFIFYLILTAFYILISFGKTGMTQDNLMEVDKSIYCNKE